jgi:hypothetical protein
VYNKAMKCPSCHLEQPNDSTACPGCGVIFEKWREHHPEPGSAANPPENNPDSIAQATGPLPAENIPPPTPENAPVEPPLESPGDEDRYKLTTIHYVGILAFIGLTAFYFYVPAKPTRTHQAVPEGENQAPVENSTPDNGNPTEIPSALWTSTPGNSAPKETPSPVSMASPLNTPLAEVSLPTYTPLPVGETTIPLPASNSTPPATSSHY